MLENPLLLPGFDKQRWSLPNYQTYFIDFHSIRWLKPSIHVGDSIVLLLQNWLCKPYLQLASKHHPASPYHKRNCQETFECCSSPQGTSAWTDGSPMRPLLFGWFGKVQNLTNIFKLSSVQISWCKVPCFFCPCMKVSNPPFTSNLLLAKLHMDKVISFPTSIKQHLQSHKSCISTATLKQTTTST